MTAGKANSRRLDHLKAPARRRLITSVLVASDLLALVAAFALASVVRFEALPYFAEYTLQEYVLLVAFIVPSWLILFGLFRLYDSHVLFGGTQEYALVFNALLLGTVGLVVLGFFARESFTISRGWLLLASALSYLLVAGARFWVRRAVYALRRQGHLLSPALIVGANQEARALAEQLQVWTTSGLKLVGCVAAAGSGDAPEGPGCRPLGRLIDLDRLVTEHGIEELIVAPTALDREQLVGIFRNYGVDTNVNLRLSSGLFEVMTTGLEVKELAYVPLISVRKARIQGLDAILKRALDYALAVPGLILLSPLLLVIAVAVRRDSPGPAIFRRRVVGSGAREFDAFKFRTMVANGDQVLDKNPQLRQQLASEGKLKGDPRVTRLGRKLRRFSLDELPQLVNVLRGEMSLVGPRMISPPEMAEYGKWGMNLLTVKPGLTGLWQVSGRADVAYDERVRLDMHYIRNWTIWLDLQLLMRTIPAVLRGKGAY
jgi:exopolysaccharide biosynthesis polyprenyl glycosylphosphotransferase